jgi:elongation factor P
MLESADLRKGLKIEIDGAPYILTQFEFVKPGKGQALYKCKLKNMLTGAQFERTYRSGEKFNEAQMEEIEMEYLYAEGDRYCFMNTKNYEQEYLTAEQVGEGVHLLKENTLCNVLFFSGKGHWRDPADFCGTENHQGGSVGERGYCRRRQQASHA